MYKGNGRWKRKQEQVQEQVQVHEQDMLDWKAGSREGKMTDVIS